MQQWFKGVINNKTRMIIPMGSCMTVSLVNLNNSYMGDSDMLALI